MIIHKLPDIDWADGEYRFTCPTCGAVITATKTDPEFKTHTTDSGRFASISCPFCSTAIWTPVNRVEKLTTKINSNTPEGKDIIDKYRKILSNWRS